MVVCFYFIYYFSNPRAAAYSCGPLFDLEVLFFFSCYQQEAGGFALLKPFRQNAVSVSKPIVLFPDRTRPERPGEQAAKCLNVPIVAALHGLATGASVSPLVLCLPLSVSVHFRGLSLSLCVSSATCLLRSPLLHLHFYVLNESIPLPADVLMR